MLEKLHKNDILVVELEIYSSIQFSSILTNDERVVAAANESVALVLTCLTVQVGLSVLQ